MEEEERQRLTVYENKKKGETKARQRRIDAHEKVISRQMAKAYCTQMRPVVYNLLKDVGYFQDQQKEVLNKDVMPWLYQQAQECATNLGGYEQYPDRMIVEYMADEVTTHIETVKAHREEVERKRLEAKR